MNVQINRIILLFLLYLLYCSPGISQNTLNPSTIEAIDKIVQKEMKKYKVMGMSMALIDSTGIIFSKGYGYSDKANYQMANAGTIYPFGSISKVITAGSVLKLQDMGKIDLDSPFVKYVPDFQIKRHFEDNSQYTIADLLTHQAGMPRTRLKDLYTDYAQPTDFYTMVKEESDNYLIAPPKTVYQYSDVGMSMLGLLAPRTANTDFANFVKAQIFDPVGMNTASYHKDSAQGNYTKGYKKYQETKVFATRFLPAFGMQASVEDLAKYMYVFLNQGKAINGNQILSPEVVNRATTLQNGDTKIRFSNTMGLGWFYRPVGFYGYPTISHGGEQKPVLSNIVMLKDQKIGIVRVINTYSEDFYVEDDILLEVFKERGISYDPDHYKEKASVSKTVEGSVLEEVSGDYATSYGLVNIERKGSKNLKVKLLAANKKFNAQWMSDNSFKLRFMLLGFIPIKVMNLFVEDVEGRKIVGRRLSAGRKIFGGEKIDFEKPATAWDNISGIYTICNLDDKEYNLLSEVTVTDYNGLKVISGKGEIPGAEKIQFCIKPIDNNQAIVQGIGGVGLLGETIKRKIVDGEEFIELAGYLFKKSLNE